MNAAELTSRDLLNCMKMSTFFYLGGISWLVFSLREWDHDQWAAIVCFVVGIFCIAGGIGIRDAEKELP